MNAAVPGEHRTLAYQPALDGVRALAVAAVLLFHGGVAWLPGGFLGVDAFFVLSGYLITSLLLAERARAGRIRLGAFWLRRARRLLPALLLVLLVVVFAFRGLLSAEELVLLRGDALAALGYVANWRMIYRGDDYFAQSSAPSPLQHTWSLGIEEQFYVVWPVLVVALFAVAAAKARAALISLCVAGAGASAVIAAVLYTPLDVNRAYFGSDARAQALLIGCALAGVLSSRAGSRRSARAVTAVGVAGIVGVMVVGWIWAHADGADAWLYHGGFMVGALAVAAVIAHAALSPQAPVGRVLALPALVWLGRISYGVYLWHWPLFGLINGERTGMDGPGLLALRIAATLAVAQASYILIERPIRTGRWPVRLARPARLPRLSRGALGIGFVAAAGVTGISVVLGTMPPPPVAEPAAIVVPSATATNAAGTLPMQRPNRKPGAEPRIAFFGDSVSWSLGTYLPHQPGLIVTVRAIQGCGIARLPDIIQLGTGHTNYPGCTTWHERWQRNVDWDDPDVSAILLDRWELMDRRLNNVYQHVGMPEYNEYLTTELELAISIAGSRGAHVVLLTAPYTRRGERYDGGLFDEDRPERVDAWNDLLRDVAARHPKDVTVIDLNKRVCPDGKFTWTIDRLRIRSDGLHFTPDGVRRWIAPWLMPQLTSIALYGSYALSRGD